MLMDGRWRPVLATGRPEGERWCNVFQLSVTLGAEGKVQGTLRAFSVGFKFGTRARCSPEATCVVKGDQQAKANMFET